MNEPTRQPDAATPGDSGWVIVDLPPGPSSPSPVAPARPLAGPTRANERIAAIDVLRGVALLGILLLNIRGFTMISAAYMNPLAAGPLEGLDRVVWWTTSLLADQKFMAIFSMLFGAGIVLMYERRDALGQRSAGLHYRRMAGLFVIGLLHAYGLWFGDVLVTYALCGLWLYPMRRLGPWLLLGLGFGLLAIGSGISVLLGWAISFASEHEIAEIMAFLNPTPAAAAEEVEAHRGGWWDQMRYRAPASLEMQTFYYLIWGGWRAGGVMLVGMALLKFGVLRGTASRSTYLCIAAVGGGLGLTLALVGLLRYPADARDTPASMFINQWNYWGSLGLAAAYLSAVMLVCRAGVPRCLNPVAAVGRTALTNYLAQSVICTLVFYGTIHRLDLFGRVSWSTQMVVVLAVWVMQLVAATWWLRRFRMGPAEWLWRWASYGQRPAFKHQ